MRRWRPEGGGRGEAVCAGAIHAIAGGWCVNSVGRYAGPGWVRPDGLCGLVVRVPIQM